MAALIITLCGLVIGLAVYLFARSVRNLAKGRCCEGCRNCPQAADCEAAAPGPERGEPSRGAGTGDSEHTGTKGG